MPSQRELIALAAAKAALRTRITRRRNECAAAASCAAQPLVWLDDAVARWRRIPPLVRYAAWPLGLLLQRSLAPRSRLAGAALRWGPLLVGALRGLAGARGRAARR